MLKNLDNYNQSETIGNGGYGKVYIAEENQTGNRVAVKFLHLLPQYHSKEAFQEEVTRLSSVHHLCLKNIVGYVTENQSEIQPEQLPGIISNYETSGSLDKEIKEEPTSWLNLANQVVFLFGIASALNKLHENKIYHGDLKPSNIFLSKNSESNHGFCLPLIGDYGLASISEPEESVTQSAFRAPELINGFLPPKNAEEGKRSASNSENETYSVEVPEPNEKTDAFSFGMLIFYLFVNKYPRGKSAKPLLQGMRPDIPKTIPHGLRKVIAQCWEHDPSQRPSMKTVMKMIIESRIDLEYPEVGEFMYEIEPQLYSLTQITLLHHDNLKARVLMNEKEKSLTDQLNNLQNDYNELSEKHLNSNRQIESLQKENQELKTQLEKLKDFEQLSKSQIEQVKMQVENSSNNELDQKIENVKAEVVNEAVNQSFEKLTEQFRDKKLRKRLLYPHQKSSNQPGKRIKKKVPKRKPNRSRGFNSNGEEESFEEFDELVKDDEEDRYEYFYEYEEEEEEEEDDLLSPQNKRFLRQISQDLESIRQKQDETDRTFQEIGSTVNAENDSKISNLNKTVDSLSEQVEKANGMVDEIKSTFIPSINSLQTDYGKIKAEINEKFSQLERTLSDITNSYQEVNTHISQLHENVETFASSEKSKREPRSKSTGNNYLGDLANYEFLDEIDQNVVRIIEDFNQRLNKIEMMMNLQNEEVSSCLERLNLLSGANLSNVQRKLSEIENLVGKITIHKDELEANLIRYAIPLNAESNKTNLNHSQPVGSKLNPKNFSPSTSGNHQLFINKFSDDEEIEDDNNNNNNGSNDPIKVLSFGNNNQNNDIDNNEENKSNNENENGIESETANNENEDDIENKDTNEDENINDGENFDDDDGINSNENDFQQKTVVEIKIEEEDEEENQQIAQMGKQEDAEFTLKPFEEFDDNQ